MLDSKDPPHLSGAWNLILNKKTHCTASPTQENRQPDVTEAEWRVLSQK